MEQNDYNYTINLMKDCLRRPISSQAQEDERCHRPWPAYRLDCPAAERALRDQPVEAGLAVRE